MKMIKIENLGSGWFSVKEPKGPNHIFGGKNAKKEAEAMKRDLDLLYKV